MLALFHETFGADTLDYTNILRQKFADSTIYIFNWPSIDFLIAILLISNAIG